MSTRVHAAASLLFNPAIDTVIGALVDVPVYVFRLAGCSDANRGTSAVVA